MSDELVIANRHGQVTAHRKVSAPRTGPAYGPWTGRPSHEMVLPGGGMMQFDLSRLTLDDYRAMRHHYQVNSSLSLLTFMMHQMDWSIECTSSKIAKAIEEMIRPVWTRMIRAIGQAYWAGFSPVALEFDNVGKYLVINKFKDLVPEECRVNWKKVEGAPSQPGAAPVHLYEFDGIAQVGGAFQKIPVTHSFWYPLMMENGDYYGKKLLKPAFAPWFFSQLIHMFANRYFERFGEPVPIGRAPFDEEIVQSDGTKITGKEVMENIIMAIRNRSVVVLPDSDTGSNSSNGSKRDFDYQIEYLESQMRGADFERYLSRLDEEMSLALFVPVLMMRTSDVGSYNLGIQHLQTYMWLLNALQGDMKEYIDRYIIRPLKRYNFGENAPEATWNPRVLGRENVETMRSIVVELVRGGAAKPNMEELGQAVGLTLEEIGQIIATDPNKVPTMDPNDPRAQKPEPGDPKGADGKPKKDERSGRPERPKRSKPRGVNEPRRTGRKISARIASQVEKAWRDDTWHSYEPDFGFRAQMAEAWEAEGVPHEEALSITDELYARLLPWFRDITQMSGDDLRGTGHVMAMFDKVLEGELDAFCGTD